MAWATGGTSLGATTAGLQTASLTAGGGLPSTVYNAVDKMAKDPRFWTSFVQTAGNDYDQAKADGADEVNALGYAFTNGLLNAMIEVSGGTDTLPAELRAADKAGESGKAYDYLRNSVNILTGGDPDVLPAAGKNGGTVFKLLKSAAGEGNEEALQGTIGRGLQKSFYNRGNPLLSMTDPNALLNPFTAGREWRMGGTVGGVLGTGMAGVNKVIGAKNQSGTANTHTVTGKKHFSAAMVTAKLTDMLKPYDPYANYDRNSAAVGRPLSVLESIAIDSVNDGLKAKPNKLATDLVNRFGWDAVFGDAKTQAPVGTPLADANPGTAVENGDVRSRRKLDGNGQNSLDANERIDYNGGKRTERAPDFAAELPSDFESFHSVMQDAGPQDAESFLAAYNDPESRKKLENDYRVLDSVKVDVGEVSKQEILELDDKVFTEKMEGFGSKFKRRGNIAGMYLDGDVDTMYYAHSLLSENDNGYKGDGNLIKKKDELHFEYIDVRKKDGTIRTGTENDTEAKFIEYLEDLYEVRPFRSVTMYSERGMCPSCRYVLEQFMMEHPNVQVNVISNKFVEGDVWKTRRKRYMEESK